MPVLVYVVSQLDQTHGRAAVEDIADATGLSHTDVALALRNLSRSSPPYLAGVEAEFDYPILITEVSERALRAVGVWPSADQMVDEMATALIAAADAEVDPDKQSRLRAAALGIGGAARSVLVEVTGRYVEQRTGL